jgi:hypothetical protein
VIEASPETQDVYVYRARNTLRDDELTNNILITKKGPEEMAKAKGTEAYNTMAAGYTLIK